MIETENIFDEKKLEAMAEEREQSRVRVTLDYCLSRVRDRKADIDALFDDNKPKEAQRLVKLLIGNELIEASDGRLRVPEFIQKGKSNQQVYCYLGTHWELLSVQVFYDFCKAGAKKMGLDPLYTEDENFMCDVFTNVAFRVMGFTQMVEPRNAVWINLKNCTVEIHYDGTFATHEHRAEDFFLYCLPYSYDPQAECPLFRKFMDEVLPDKDTQSLVMEYVGYVFARKLRLEKMLVLSGGGSNGKSVLLSVLEELYGTHNVSQCTLSSLTTDPEARCQLRGKLANISSESNKTIDTAILKMIVSGESVECRKLYVGTQLLTNPPRLFTSYNQLPPLENTYGYRRRWILVPFNVTIPPERQDPGLIGKLCTELPGILNWALELLAKLIGRVKGNTGEGFTFSKVCNQAMSEYTRSGNSVLMFLTDCCTIDNESTPYKIKQVFSEYLAYCRSMGVKQTFTQRNFIKYAEEWGAQLTVYQKVKYLNIRIDSSAYE